MVRERGPEWGHVTILKRKKYNDKLECKYCKLRLRFDAE
jgi:hypothetical protein